MSVFSDAYLDNLKYQQELAEAQQGAGANAGNLYAREVEKAKEHWENLNQEGETARSFGEIVSAPLIHEGVKGAVERLKTKASKEIGSAVDDLVDKGKEFARQKLQPYADQLGVDAEDIVNGKLGLKPPSLADKARSAMNDAFENAKTKLAQRSGNAIGVEDPEETLKGLSDIDKAKVSLTNRLNTAGKPLQEQAQRATRVVKSREQTLNDMAKRAERSQKQMRQRANKITDEQERLRINNEADDRLAKLREITSNPKQPAVKLDPSDPDYLERSRFQMPSAENDARLKFLEENNPREFEETTNPFRFKNVMGQDASEALGNYKAQASKFESRAKFLERTNPQNRARLARGGQVSESEGTNVADQLKPMRDFMKARETELQEVSRFGETNPSDMKAMGESRFTQIKNALRDRLTKPANSVNRTQAQVPADDQIQAEEEVEQQAQREATQSAEKEITNPSFDPHSVSAEHGEGQLDPQNDPTGLPNTSGEGTPATDTEGATEATNPAPPPAEEGAKVEGNTTEDIGENVGEDLTKAVETDAELGGPEDPIGDIVAGIVGTAGLLGSLFAPRPKETPPPPPPPVPQLNPSTQMGISG